jgi:hypothetical protein
MAYLPSMESGGLQYPHDTPPHPFMPSPTFKYSSRSCCECASTLKRYTPHTSAITLNVQPSQYSVLPNLARISDIPGSTLKVEGTNTGSRVRLRSTAAIGLQRQPRRNHPSNKGEKMTKKKTTKPTQQGEEDDIEPQRVLNTKRAARLARDKAA